MTEHELFNAAAIAGRLAVVGMEDRYPCGFAMVLIRPARGKFVKYLKDNNIGRAGTYGGYIISSHDTCAFQGQNVDAKEEGCYAFAAVLQANGINASVESRLD